MANVKQVVVIPLLKMKKNKFILFFLIFGCVVIIYIFLNKSKLYWEALSGASKVSAFLTIKNNIKVTTSLLGNLIKQEKTTPEPEANSSVNNVEITSLLRNLNKPEKPTVLNTPEPVSSVIIPDEWQSTIILERASECPSIVKKDDKTDSKSCRIPELDPFHPSIMQYIRETGGPYCPGTTYGKIWNGTLTFVNPDVISASYRPIRRDGDFFHTLGPAVKVEPGKPITDEMLEVSFTLKNGQVEKDFFLQVSTQKRDYKTKSTKAPGIPLNILVLGIDSLSYGNTLRKLPEVASFLKENNALFFTGHTVIGDGTTPQLTAMLTGKHVEEQYEARTGMPRAKPLDGWTWIFRQMKEYGYLTGISEDGIWDGPFQYRLMGFKDPPTDFYPRPFFLDIARRTRYPSDRCINNRNVPEIHFEYVSTVFNSYPKTLKFFVSFNAGYSHHEINNVKKNQGAMMTLLKDLKSKGHLENTLLIVMGDHGLRFGKVRTQVQGKLEERLPLFSIVTPPWFAKKYPEVMANLKKNTERLTSWFDVYATFRHVLSYPDLPTGLTRGQSLFVEVPTTRSCRDAGTTEHWCPCLQWVTVDINHVHIQNAARAAVQFINDLLSKDNTSAQMCSELTFKEVNFAQLERPNDDVVQTHLRPNAKFKQGEEYFCRYQVQFVTSPNQGVFEATVKYHKKRFTVDTSISRINEYGEQPKCVAARLPHVRKYCLCKDYKGALEG